MNKDGVRGSGGLLGIAGFLLVALLLRAAPSGASDFTDVPDDHPFHDDIAWLVAEGITTGFPDATYRPAAKITRASMAAFLYRYEGAPAFTPPSAPTFPDVPSSHPFFVEIEWAVAEGITSGFPGGKFRPALQVTRQSMSAFLYRVADEPAFEPPLTPSFVDVPLTHPFFAEVEWMVDADITTGFAGGKFKPAADVTRQSMAAFLHRLDALLHPLPTTTTSSSTSSSSTSSSTSSSSTSTSTSSTSTSTSTTSTTLPPPEVVEHCGTLTGDETWTNASIHVTTCPVTVPDGVQLTVTQGAIVKAATSGPAFTVAEGGSLVGEGTSETPVTFTSYDDDSVGGDTNGDDSGVFVHNHIDALTGSTVTLDHTEIRHGRALYTASPGSEPCPTITITNSLIRTHSDLACAGDGITIQNTTFNIDTSPNAGFALNLSYLDPSGIDLDGTGANTFTGPDPGHGIGLYFTTIAAGHTWTINGTTNAVLIPNHSINTINGTLHLKTGAIVKTLTNGGNTLTVASGGSLVAEGTSEAPVILTGFHDDSAGGDTNGDDSGVFVHNHIDALTGSTVTLDHTEIRHGRALYTASPGSEPCPTITITNSLIRTHSDLACAGDGITIQNTTFNIDTSPNAGFALNLSYLDPSGIDLDGTGANTFTGPDPGHGIGLYFTTIAAGHTWTINGTTNAVLIPNHSINTINGTLHLKTGAIVKTLTNGGNTLTVASGGSLVAEGTSEAPVILTGFHDDSAGGDTNGDDSGVFVHNHIDALTGSTVILDHTEIRHGRALYTASPGSEPCPTITITNSLIRTHSDLACAGDGITIQNTTFNIDTSPNAGFALNLSYLDPSGIDLDGTGANTFTGPDPGHGIGLYFTTIAAGHTWTINGTTNAVLIPNHSINTINGTLHLKTGAIVKTLTNGGNTLTVASGGSLVAEGTSEAPVILTGFHDDSAGGDTNGDDSGVFVHNHIDALTGSTVTLDHTEIRHGRALYTASPGSEPCPTITITNSLIRTHSDLACAGDGITIQNTTFNIDTSPNAGFALNLSYLDPSGIDLDGTGANTFTGPDPGHGIGLYFTTIAAGHTWTINGTTNAVLIPNHSINTINGTLHLKTGAIVKTLTNGGNTLTVASGGSLVAEGTSEAPVILTGFHDDSAGGDTNGDDSGVFVHNHIDALTGSTVTLDHTEIRHGRALYTASPGSEPCPTITITNSLIRTHSDLACAGDGITIQNTTFNIDTSPNAGFALNLSYLDPSGIDLDGTGANTFTGPDPGHGIGLYFTTIAAGHTWTINGTTNAVLIPNHSINTINGTLHLKTGAIVKTQANTIAFTVVGGGQLTTQGGAPFSDHVYFASFKDDTVGGDTNGDGDETGPAPGDYQTAIQADPESIVQLDYTVIAHASTGLAVNSAFSAQVQDSYFKLNTRAISASYGWDGVFPCSYADNVRLTNVKFGPQQSETLAVTEADFALIVATRLLEGTLDWPVGWSIDLRTDDTDTISVAIESCGLIDEDPGTPASYSVVATAVKKVTL